MRMLLVLVVALSACKKVERHPPVKEAPLPAPAAPATGCIADSIRTLSLANFERPDCTAGDDQCRIECEQDNAPACFWRATILQNERKDEAMLLFSRACQLGLAISCTNYAAGLWVPGATEDANTCARRVFDKACAAKEPYACGMLGRMTITHAQDADELARGRTQLQRACDELGGPPCKMLANHLETGELGTFEPAQITALLTRACEGGDASACDDLARAKGSAGSN